MIGQLKEGGAFLRSNISTMLVLKTFGDRLIDRQLGQKRHVEPALILLGMPSEIPPKVFRGDTVVDWDVETTERVGQAVRERETKLFLAHNSDYPDTEENRDAMVSVLKETGIPVTARNLEACWSVVQERRKAMVSQ